MSKIDGKAISRPAPCSLEAQKRLVLPVWNHALKGQLNCSLQDAHRIILRRVASKASGKCADFYRCYARHGTCLTRALLKRRQPMSVNLNWQNADLRLLHVVRKSKVIACPATQWWSWPKLQPPARTQLSTAGLLPSDSLTSILPILHHITSFLEFLIPKAFAQYR